MSAGAISEKEYLDGLAAAGLADAKIIEAQTFDRSMIKALLESEITQPAGALADLTELDRIAEGLDSKIKSAKIYARKP